MSFLRRVAGLSLRDRVRSSVIREELGVDPPLLRVERSQMRWLGHLLRMPPRRLPGQVPLVGDPGEDPGHAGETMAQSHFFFYPYPYPLPLPLSFEHPSEQRYKG
ncbi:hypothetical protein N1851_030227 [Merluccius polli]|uniref:Uncharacterized protein n=1 Tax=Merluccius polli TaxID=89951 RepID=A0AA47M5V1_MERPO|nr:hypothetical protein N1851_030227 [Merluccius polli]